MTDDRRLIEDYLPIQAISADMPAACLARQAGAKPTRGAGRGVATLTYGR